ncbi:MAG: CapA family protein [Actinobacteria bacterium]|nr:CapA family protein [Actinomycetota bacterium]
MNAKRSVIVIIFAISIATIVGIAYSILSSSYGQDIPYRSYLGLAYDQFSSFREARDKLPERQDEVSLIVVGDIMPSRGVANRIRAHNDFNYPFLATRDYLKTADIIFGNLESPITPGRKIQSKEMVFRTDPGFEGALKEAGFSVLSLANNHTPNFGSKGLRDTFQYLNQAGIRYIGAGKDDLEANSAVHIEVRGIRFAFLAYNDTDVVPQSYGAKGSYPGTAFMGIERMTKAVKDAKRKADFVIVSMHAGEEYVVEPNQSQIDFAHAAIDAGAELVVGHHPHVVQRVENYREKYIFYSLGNFIFDQMWSKETREGIIAKAFFNRDGITKIELQPTLIEDYAQPRILEGQQAESVLKRLKISLGDRVVFTWNQKRGVFEQKVRKAIYNKQADTSFKIVKSVAADLNKDSHQERYNLQSGRLRIFQGSKLIWESQGDWWVDDFYLADSTGDGGVNINLSIWKSGDFGDTKPFWVKENDQSIKNHFFVFNLVNGKVRPVWQSSNLDRPNCEFLFEDVDGDGKQELIVLEGDYSDKHLSKGEHIAIWRWKEWRFYNEWRSLAGEFKNLDIEGTDENKYIVVDVGN